MTTHKNSVQYFFCGPRILQESLKGLSSALFSNKTTQVLKIGMRFIVLLSFLILAIGFLEFTQVKRKKKIPYINEHQIKPMAKCKLT